MSNQPPISFRPGAPAPGQQYISNMNAFLPQQQPKLPYGVQPPLGFNQHPQPSQFGMPVPGVNPFGNFQQQDPQGRQTYFGKSTVAMMPQTMSYQQINHLKNVMPCLEREFKATNYRVVIINNAENPGSANFDLTIDVEVILFLGDNNFPLKIQVPKEFPNQAPVVYSKGGVTHKLIDKVTQKIDSSTYYTWEKKNSKVVDLVAATEKYFNNDNPFENKEGKKFEEMLENLESNFISGLAKFDVKAFYNGLSFEDKQTVISGDQFKSIELLKSVKEYKETVEKRQLLNRCIAALAQTVAREAEQAETTFYEMKRAQITTASSTSELNTLLTSVQVESQRYDKNNVIHSIDQYSKKIEQSCMPEALCEQLKEVNEKTALEKTINDFVKRRSEYNKLVILKGKLSGVQLMAA